MCACVWRFGQWSHFGSRAVVKVLLQRALAAKNTVSVTFGAPLFGRQIRSFCNCSEYVTFSIMPATMVRELTACVTFGAPRVGVPVASRRRPIFGHPLGMACGDAFGANAIMNSSKASACGTTLERNSTSAFVFAHACRNKISIVLNSALASWLAPAIFKIVCACFPLRGRKRRMSFRSWSVPSCYVIYLVQASRGVFLSSPLVY